MIQNLTKELQFQVGRGRERNHEQEKEKKGEGERKKRILFIVKTKQNKIIGRGTGHRG